MSLCKAQTPMPTYRIVAQVLPQCPFQPGRKHQDGQQQRRRSTHQETLPGRCSQSQNRQQAQAQERQLDEQRKAVDAQRVAYGQ